MNAATQLFHAAIIAATATLTPLQAAPNSTPVQPGEVDFGRFNVPEEGQFVEVNVQGNLIRMAARLARESEPEVAEILDGLKAVRVNVIGINDSNAGEIRSRILSVREQLEEQGWERVVTVQDNKENVGVFIKLLGEDAIQGIAVTALHRDREAVFVNIVGNIRPEQIATIGERFNLDPLKQLSRKLGSN